MSSISTSPSRCRKFSRRCRNNPIRTRLSLSGPMIVARDLAHAKLREKLERGEPLPDYFKNHPDYYAGPAKTPTGYASGSFGPTTAGRMDSYVDQFQAAGGSMVMLAKGNRSSQVREACAKHHGFYLGSFGGAACRTCAGLHHQGRGSCASRTLGWKRSGALRSKISPRSSSLMTRGMISSRN